MRARFLVLAAGALLLVAAPARAQTGLTITFQGGAAVPLEKFQGVDLKTGAGFDGTVAYRVYRDFSLYAGWDWHRFVVTWPDRPFKGDARKLDENGWVFGARWDHPLREGGPVTLIARAGGTASHFEVKDDDGKVTEDSGHGIGWEAGLGVGYTFMQHWQVAPMLRTRMLSRDLTVNGIQLNSRLTYLAMDLGVAYRF